MMDHNRLLGQGNDNILADATAFYDEVEKVKEGLLTDSHPFKVVAKPTRDLMRASRFTFATDNLPVVKSSLDR